MNRDRGRRICFLLLALLLLVITMSTTVSLATHTASCCVPECVPCKILAKVQESLRLLGGATGFLVGLLALLLLLGLTASARLLRQNMESLVFLKARLNN